jgi:hypothetical protein
VARDRHRRRRHGDLGRALGRGVSTPTPDPIAKIEDYPGAHSDNPKPFIWTATADDILAKSPAAAVVFAAEVNKRTSADPRVADLQKAIARATAEGDHDEAAAPSPAGLDLVRRAR